VRQRKRRENYFLKLARDLRKSGSDLVVEEELAVVSIECLIFNDNIVLRDVVTMVEEGDSVLCPDFAAYQFSPGKASSGLQKVVRLVALLESSLAEIRILWLSKVQAYESTVLKNIFHASMTLSARLLVPLASPVRIQSLWTGSAVGPSAQATKPQMWLKSGRSSTVTPRTSTSPNLPTISHLFSLDVGTDVFNNLLQKYNSIADSANNKVFQSSISCLT
jgi:hypothetical protein